MAEIPTEWNAELLQQKLAEQDELKALFETASPAEDYKEDINLDPAYREVTAFRMNKTHFLVQHVPTTLINSWSAMTGPRSLRTGVVAWVDEIQSVFPPTSKKED